MRRLWLVAVILAGASACGSSGTTSTASVDDDPAAASLPADEWPADELLDPAYFEVGWVPERFQVEVAGSGETPPYLSDDSEGTIEPSLMVVRDDWDGTSEEGIVRVSSVDYSGLQGTLAQASASYGSAPTDQFEINGDPAHYGRGGSRELGSGVLIEWWSEVVIDVGDGWALRVSGQDADRAALVDLAERASLDEDHRPILDALPDGLRVVSRVTPEQIEAADGFVRRGGADNSVVDVTGNAVVWVDRTVERSYNDPGGSRQEDRLSVAGVPGSTANLEAIGWLRTEAGFETGWGGVESVDALQIHGRPALLSRAPRTAALSFTQEDGSLMLVTSVGDPPLSDDELVRVAESVEPVDQTTWDQRVTELEGGPGLHPDPGRTELARGELDGQEWVLQNSEHEDLLFEGISSGPGAENFIGGANFPVPGDRRPAECIKLESGERVCLGGSGGGPLDRRGHYDRSRDETRIAEELPYFDVGLVMPGPAKVRVTTDQRVIEVDTIELAGTSVRLYVLGFRPGEVPLQREYLDAEGNPMPEDPGL